MRFSEVALYFGFPILPMQSFKLQECLDLLVYAKMYTAFMNVVSEYLTNGVGNTSLS